MKVLFLTSLTGDYIASCLWNGLCAILGSHNVHDAVGCSFLHESHATGFLPRQAIPGGTLADCPPCDVMVINAAFLRQFDWHLPIHLRDAYLKPGGKIAYVEGWDGSYEVNDPATQSNPPFHVDRVFRREIDPAFVYPYACEPLLMAAPRRWYDEPQTSDGQRDVDVFCVSYHASHPTRWQSFQQVFSTSQRYNCVVGSNLHYGEYTSVLRRSKLCVCPPGAGDGHDCTRNWEAVSVGAIPIFVNHSPVRREPWFEPDMVYECRIEDLARTIDEAMASDLAARRQRLREHCLKHHTTEARARQFLTSLGYEP